MSEPVNLICVGMTGPCTQPVSHVDNKGYCYCTTHGETRKRGGVPTRKLTRAELQTLSVGGTVSYRRKG